MAAVTPLVWFSLQLSNPSESARQQMVGCLYRIQFSYVGAVELAFSLMALDLLDEQERATWIR